MQVRQIGSALIRLGVQPGERVSICAQTRIEWVVIDMAILHAGAVTVPIYQSNLPDECQYIVENSGAGVVFTEDEAQTKKFRLERSRLPNVKKVIQICGEVHERDGWAIPLSEFLETGEAHDPELQERRKSVTKDSILTLIYTSGTTGRPKGVVTTHDNMIYEAEAIAAANIVRTDDIQLLFLPMAHVFAKVLEIAWIATGHVLAFAESMATLKDNMRETRPTLMAGVPRVFEKFYAAIVTQATAKSGLSSLLFQRAVELSNRHGDAVAQNRSLGLSERMQLKALKAVVFREVERKLGQTLGGRMRVMVSGGAPLGPQIAWFFRHAGYDILEGFGLTETSAATCINLPGHNKIGTVGPVLPGTEVRLADDGELLIRGRGVARGYWQNDTATAEAFKDGWFLTGDLAKIDTDGHVAIVDRKKDIIVTAGGKNVAPQNIENLIKTNKLISQVVVHGDKRNFLTALVTLDSDTLKLFADSHRLGQASYATLTQKPEVYQAVQDAIESFNSQLARYETIKKFRILEHDFSQDSGELTASLKVKRKVVNQRYKTIFDNFYEGASHSAD